MRDSTSFSGKLSYPLSGNANDMLLFKIQKRRYLCDLQQGKVYMKNISYHRSNASLDPDSCVGDAEEGFVAKPEMPTIIDNMNGKKYHLPDGCCTISMFEKNPIFCAMSVDFVSSGTSTQNPTGFYFHPPEKIFKDFVGNEEEYGVIILDKKRFIERCETSLNKKGIEYLHHRVFYPNKNKIDVITSSEHPDLLQSVFLKNEKYAHQKEYRIWINTDVADHFEFDIGNISDISIILPIDAARNGLRVSGNFHEMSPDAETGDSNERGEPK